MKKLCILFFMIVTAHAYTQTDGIRFISVDQLSNYKKFDWSTVEMKISKNEKLTLIDQFKKGFDHYDKVPNVDPGFHIVDINSDQYPDLIFDGDCDIWESFQVDIALGGKTGFKMINQYFHSSIPDMIMRDGKIFCIVVYQQHYSVSVTDEEIYLTFNSTTSILELQYKRVYQTCMDVPTTYYKTPIQFAVKNDKYRLRDAPGEGDIQCRSEGQEDNILARFKVGSKGKAYGEKTDKVGDVWWLVELNASDAYELKFEGNQEYFPNTSFIGWMNSKYLIQEEEKPEVPDDLNKIPCDGC